MAARPSSQGRFWEKKSGPLISEVIISLKHLKLKIINFRDVKLEMFIRHTEAEKTSRLWMYCRSTGPSPCGTYIVLAMDSRHIGE